MLASEVLGNLGIKYQKPHIIEGVTEYCGIQRVGKSTLMVKDWGLKLLPAGYLPEDTYSNFRIFVEGVNCLITEGLIEAVFKMKRDKVRRKVILFDEVGQFFGARGWKASDQTDFVNFGWQMPKRDIVMLYSSNVGNSADVVLRDVAWQTVMPKYFHGATRQADYIVSTVILNYELKRIHGIVSPYVFEWQELFDTHEPIE